MNRRKGQIDYVTIIMWSIIIGCVFLFINLSKKGIQKAEENILVTKNDLVDKYKTRLNCIPDLLHKAREYAIKEKLVFLRVLKLKSNAIYELKNFEAKKHPDEEDIRKLNESQQELLDAMDSLFIISEKYLEGREAEFFESKKTIFLSTENSIVFLKERYNMYVDHYNSFIETFPWKIIAPYFQFEVIDVFEDVSSRGTKSIK